MATLVCSGCGKMGMWKVCGGCLLTAYCNPVCQKAHYHHHIGECELYATKAMAVLISENTVGTEHGKRPHGGDDDNRPTKRHEVDKELERRLLTLSHADKQAMLALLSARHPRLGVHSAAAVLPSPALEEIRNVIRGEQICTVALVNATGSNAAKIHIVSLNTNGEQTPITTVKMRGITDESILIMPFTTMVITQHRHNDGKIYYVDDRGKIQLINVGNAKIWRRDAPYTNTFVTKTYAAVDSGTGKINIFPRILSPMESITVEPNKSLRVKGIWKSRLIVWKTEEKFVVVDPTTKKVHDIPYDSGYSFMCNGDVAMGLDDHGYHLLYESDPSSPTFAIAHHVAPVSMLDHMCGGMSFIPTKTSTTVVTFPQDVTLGPKITTIPSVGKIGSFASIFQDVAVGKLLEGDRTLLTWFYRSADGTVTTSTTILPGYGFIWTEDALFGTDRAKGTAIAMNWGASTRPTHVYCINVFSGAIITDFMLPKGQKILPILSHQLA